MAVASITPPPDLAAIFHQGVQRNVLYWQTWLQQHTESHQLEPERDGLVRAIVFALKLPETWPLAVGVIMNFAPYMERWGYWDIWQQLLEQALKAVRQFDDSSGEIQLLLLLARLSARQDLGPETVRYYRQTIRLARRHGDTLTAARACSNLGYHFTESGHWQRAEILGNYALAVFEQLDHSHGRAHTHNHLGALYLRRHRWDLAQLHLEQACAIWQEMGDKHALIFGYQNLGLLYTDTGEYKRALAHLQQVSELADVTGERAWQASGYINQGRIYLLIGDLSQAERFYRQAETILRKYSNYRDLARVWNGLGLVCHRQGRRTEGRLYQAQALQIWQSLSVEFEEIDVLLEIGECALDEGNIVEAQTRLEAVERLVGQPVLREKYHFLQPRLEAYRTRLWE